MRKSFLFSMVLVGSLIALPGCGSLGAMLPSLLIDGGFSLLVSLLGSLIAGAITPAATA
jgi:hypothetical protein